MATFIDKTKLKVEAGRGGNGVVSWRREKFEDRGGPDGGDGGDGGSVIFRSSKDINTLQTFRYRQIIRAESGGDGSRQKRHGKNGQNEIIDVPLGTQVLEEGTVIADLVEHGQESVVAKGGKGGFGNAHFTSSTRRAPKIAEKGEPGEKKELELELKIIADVGLVGLPNAGKSTLLSVISNARPEIADYPFTTLVPHLGVVDYGKSSLLFADIPGLIEGASEGKGLGDDFLRHVERTAVLVHLVDAYSQDLAADYKTIIKELKDYKVDLSDKPRILVLSKCDGLDDELLADRVKELKKTAKEDILTISSHTKAGIDQLLKQISAVVKKTRQAEKKRSKQASKDVIELNLEPSDEDWQVVKKRNKFLVSGVKIEKFALRTDTDNEFAVLRLRDIMKKMGITHELLRQGVKTDDRIIIGEVEITF